MPSGAEIARQPGFWDKPEKDQIEALSGASPAFKSATPEVQKVALQSFRKMTGPSNAGQGQQSPSNGKSQNAESRFPSIFKVVGGVADYAKEKTLPYIEKGVGAITQEIPKLAGQPKPAQDFSRGIGKGLADVGVDMTSPVNAALIAGMAILPEAEVAKFPQAAKLLKALSGAMKYGFAGAQGVDLLKMVPEASEAVKKGDYEAAGKAVSRAVADLVLIKTAVGKKPTLKIEGGESVAGEPAARPPEPTPSKSSTPPPEPTKASPPKAQTPVPTTEPPKAPPVEAQKPAITLPATPPSEPAQEPRRPVEPPKPANPEDKIAANNKRIAELEARLRAGEKPAPPPEPTPQTPARGKVEKQKAIGASTEARSLERSVSAEEAKKSRPVQPPVKSKTSGAPANPPPEKVATPEAPKANEGSGAPVPPEHAELHQVVGSIFAQATAGNLEGVKLTAKDATGKTLVALEFDADNPARNVTDMLSRFRGIKSIEVDPIGGKATGLKRWTKFLTGQEIKGPPLNMPARGAPAKPPGVNFKQPPEPSLEAKMPKVG